MIKQPWLQLNAVGLLAVSAVLIVAFTDQLVLNDLPCPLCILQRAGFVASGFGLALNLRFGVRASHYAITIIGAMVGAAIATRQILIHVLPSSGGYGNLLFGLHLYTWAFLLFTLIVLATATMLLFDRQFLHRDQSSDYLPGGLARNSLILYGLIVFANGISTVLECSGGLCPDDPTKYLLLQ